MLECWDECRELQRNDWLEIIARSGGVTRLPEVVDTSPASMALLGGLARLVIEVMEMLEIQTVGTWIFYVDTEMRAMSFAPRDWVSIAVEKRLIDATRLEWTERDE